MTIPTNEMAARWVGHRYGLQALKPAVEPIIVFQKPYEGKPLDNIVSSGAGALNIDGGRIPTQTPVTINRFTDGAKPWGDAKGEEFDSVLSTQGRWPANLILEEDAPLQEAIGDSGGASRFFYNVQSKLDESDPVYYCGKVTPKERNAGLEDKNIHPTLKPIDLCRYLATLLLPPAEYTPRRLFIPFSGVGSEMIGAGLAGWERVCGVEFDTENSYVDIAEKRLQHWLGENK